MRNREASKPFISFSELSVVYIYCKFYFILKIFVKYCYCLRLFNSIIYCSCQAHVIVLPVHAYEKITYIILYT